MANWNNPTVSTDYDDVLTDLASKDIDSATMFLSGTETNQPTGSIRYNRSLNKFQEWSGAAWADLVIGLAGGGTGAATASAARTSLGLGSMATQNNSAVNITGGTIAGVTMSAAVITSGTLALARGGTGASLALGAIGSVLKSNGSAVVFGDGSDIENLNASKLASGTVPLARLSGITVTQMASANISQFTNDSAFVTASIINSLNASNLTSGTVPLARLSALTVTQFASANISQWTNDSGFVTSSIINALNASNLTTGTVPLARLVGITVSQMASANISQFTNDSAFVTASIINSLNASNLSSGTVPSARLSGTYSEALTFSNVTSLTGTSLSVVNGTITNLRTTAGTDLTSSVGLGIKGPAAIASLDNAGMVVFIRDSDGATCYMPYWTS